MQIFINKIKTAFAFSCLLAACAGTDGVFPDVVTSLTETEAVLPNPISIIADEDNSQILVANSNVDIFFERGSLTVLSVSASDAEAPVLSAAHVIDVPNFAGEMSFDDASDVVYLPFREALPGDESQDQIHKFSLTASSVSPLLSAGVASNPFGSAFSGDRAYIVSDDGLMIFDSSLTALATVDLSVAEDADLSDSDSSNVEYVAVDAARNVAVVGNPGGSLFVVDLATNALSAVIDGPESTRNIIVDGDFLYALDPVNALVWVFNMSVYSAPSSIPGSVDDSTFLVATISVGLGSNGMELDSVGNRLYVANSLDNTISVIDTLTFLELTRISVDEDDLVGFSRDGDFPFALTLGTFNGTQYLFVAAFSANSVVMINTDTLRVVEVYPGNTL